MSQTKVTIGLFIALTVLVSWLAFADEDREWSMTGPDVEVAANAEYQSECGACHLAYPPGLLPARSWTVLMEGLDDHFGENAELDAATRSRMTAYLTEHAADHGTGWLSKRILRSVGEARTPLRISEVPAIAREHDEIPRRLYRDNPEVGSLSNCTACHRRAEAGFYDEHRVAIPGYGRWDD